MNISPAIVQSPGDRPWAQRILKSLAISIGISFICALLLTYVMPVSDSFWLNLVFSLCIGLLATLFKIAGQALLWGRRTPGKTPFITFLVMVAIAAYLIGTFLAARLLGLPTDNLASYLSHYAIGLIVLTIFICLGVSLFYWNLSNLADLKNQTATEKARSAAIEKQALQAQLQLLQAQIEPHMLFNTLATLQSLIAVDPPRAQQMLDQLIHYLRATLSSSRTEHTTLAHEFGLMEAYLELMSLRMGPRLSYSLHLPDALRAITLAPMLLQPLIENAIKHGLEPKIDGGSIAVTATRQNDQLLLQVNDTGLGLTPLPAVKANTDASHLGLSNIQDRLQALHGSRASLRLMANLPQGVIAELRLPL